jgi:hypothetical protein
MPTGTCKQVILIFAMVNPSREAIVQSRLILPPPADVA